MAARTLLFHDKARQAIAAGVRTVADAVRLTLGPKGLNTLLGGAQPRIVRDGSAIANSIELSDPFQNLGVRLVREAALQTKAQSGGGTTTTILLADALVSEGMRCLAQGWNATHIDRGIMRAVASAQATLREESRPVRDNAELIRIAGVAAGEAEIGALVATALEKVGVHGAFLWDTSQTASSSLDVLEGFQFGSGYASPYFVTDAEKQLVILENPLVFLCDEAISAISELIPVLEHALRTNHSLLIIAHSVEGEALATLVTNKLRGELRVAAVRAPGRGALRDGVFADLAVITGATILSHATGIAVSATNEAHLGSVERVVITAEKTSIVGGRSGITIKPHLDQLLSAIEKSESDMERAGLRDRLARLAGSIALIHVGAATDSERLERQRRFEQAVAAAQAAMSEGVAPGGGIAYLSAQKALRSLAGGIDEQQGIEAVRRALEAPVRQLAAGAGFDGAVVAQFVRRLQWGYGFNAECGRYEDLPSAGIVDPTRVVVQALVNAASAARLILSIELAVTDSDAAAEAGRESARRTPGEVRRAKLRTRGRQYTGRELRPDVMLGRISFESAAEAAGVDIPVEIRKPNLALVIRTFASQPIDLPPGIYYVTAFLLDGTALSGEASLTAGEEIVATLTPEEPILDWLAAVDDAESYSDPQASPGASDAHTDSPQREVRTRSTVPVEVAVRSSSEEVHRDAWLIGYSGDPIANGSSLHEEPEKWASPERMPDGNWRVRVSGHAAIRLVQLSRPGEAPICQMIPPSDHQRSTLCIGYEPNGGSQLAVCLEDDVAQALLRYRELGRQEEAAHLAGSVSDSMGPLTITLACYSLLRTAQTTPLRDRTESLWRNYPWLSDGVPIYAEQLARQGDHSGALEVLLEIPLRGLPLFGDGLTYALDRLRLYVEAGEGRFDPGRLARAESVLTSLQRIAAFTDFSRPLLTFTGADPAWPDAEPLSPALARPSWAIGLG